MEPTGMNMAERTFLLTLLDPLRHDGEHGIDELPELGRQLSRGVGDLAHEEPRQRRSLCGVVDPGADQPFDALRVRSVGLERGADPLRERLEGGLEDRGVERLLVAEVVDDRRPRDADRLGDVLQARPGVPPIGELDLGCLEDQIPGLLGDQRVATR